jgi:hypothetical protein
MLKAAERQRQDQSIDLRVLINGDNASFLRKFLEQRIKSSDDKARVMFVVSSPMSFERGAEVSAMTLDANCDCRIFYIQMSPRNGRDDLEKILASTQTRRLEVTTPLEFRKLLASIIRELEAF